jgi:AAA family ATP:ADP antiporter
MSAPARALPVPLLARVVAVRREELAALGWSFLYFFCLLASYYMVRPVRDEMAVQFGSRNLHWLFAATFLSMFALIPVFGWLASRFAVRRLLPIVYGFFALNLVGFHLALDAGIAMRELAPLFFVWVSVFNLFVVSVFWSFMADLWSNDQAKRLFGFVSAGGSVGAIAGPALTAWAAPLIGIKNLLLVSALVLAASIACIVMLLRIQSVMHAGAQRFLRSADGAGGHRPSIWEGVIRIARSPYLAGICVFLVCYTLLSTLLYYQQTQLVPQVVPTAEERTRLFATIDLAVNVLTVLLQMFVTGRLLSRFGMTAMLAALPALSVVGFFTLGAATVLPVLVVFGVLRRAGEYAISKPSRETLFTVVPREEKYQAKNVIDTVIHRGGDAASSWLAAGLQAIGLSLSGMAYAGVPVALLWLATATYLGREHDRKRAALPPDPDSGAPS